MARPRKNADEAAAEPAPLSKPKGNDAIVTVNVETAGGTESRRFRVAGFLGNTLAWQRSGKGLEQMLLPGLLKAFGGQVTPE